MDLKDRVRVAIRRHDLVRPGMRVIAALSGGPDSVALTLLLQSLAAEEQFTFVGVAHLNHGLRNEAGDDAAFCEAFSARLQLPLDLGSADVRARARRDHASIETAAHAERYEFLTAAAARLRADRVALGHTLDDQAETVLLRLLRGAGTKGLAGMHPRHGIFIRPILGVRRQELRVFLDGVRQDFRVDASNSDVSMTRNRVRGMLVPLLEREFNPRIVHILADEAELAREEWRFLRGAAQSLIHESARPTGTGWTLDPQSFRHAPQAVARAALRLLMEGVADGRPVALRHVSAVLDLCGRPSGALDLPGHRVERVADSVVLTKRQAGGRPDGSAGVASVNFFEYPLSIPGETRIPEAGCSVWVEQESPGMPHAAGVGPADTVRVALDGGELPLRVRSRRPGDRLTLGGAKGRKKVQDLLVDRKVPRARRDEVPIVVDARDRIVWVAGHGIGGDFRVTDSAQVVIVLRLKLWGGSA